MLDFTKPYNNLTTYNNVFSGYLFFNLTDNYIKIIRYISVLNWVYVMVMFRIIIFIFLSFKMGAITKIKR